MLYLFNIPFVLILLVSYPYDLFLIALIPIWVQPIYKQYCNGTLKQLLLLYTFSLILMSVIYIGSFLLFILYGPDNPSPLIPSYAKFAPFPFFSSLILVSGICFIYFLFYVCNRKKHNKLKIEF